MHRYVERLARLFALLGGIVLSALIIMVCLSIVGRSLNSILNGDMMQEAMPAFANALLALGVGPINGDFELVEAGMAFAIFAFLPLCHLRGGHASVDIFTQSLSPRLNQFLGLVIEVIFAAVLVVIANQLLLGTLSKQASGQTSFLLQFPVWWAYAASVAGAIVAAFVAVYTASMRALELVTGRQILPDATGADH